MHWLFTLTSMLTLTASAGGDDFVGREFWLSPRRTAVASAAQLLGAADPWTAAALRVQAFDDDLWYEPPLTDEVPALSPRRLAAVRDDRAFDGEPWKAPEELPPEIRDEADLYWQAVGFAARLPAASFARAAQANRYLTFGHLYTEPAKYRGRVVSFTGRLTRLKKLDPPEQARVRGVATLYEGWIFLDQPGAHPLCVILPHAPSGVSLGDDLNVRVSVDGYFFKRYRYISGRTDDEGNKIALSTVLLIAPTLTPKPATASALSADGSLFSWIIGFACLVAAFMVGLIWWFRRNDRLVQQRLQAVRAQRVVEQAAELEKTLNEGAVDAGANGIAN
jgi:hypothetical protein